MTLTLGAALLLGLAASGHCLVMCGGITAALGMATARREDGRTPAALLIGYQVGRMLSYAIAGALLGGSLGWLVDLVDIEAVRRSLRMLSAIALLLAALIAFGRVRDRSFGIGRHIWRKLAPLGRKLLPVASLPRALGFGMVWGWMPCGFVYTVLVIAALQLDALRAGATMLAFGTGTAPALLVASFGAQRIGKWIARPAGRRAAGAALLASAVLTAAGPWLVDQSPWLHAWLPFLCTVDAG